MKSMNFLLVALLGTLLNPIVAQETTTHATSFQVLPGEQAGTYVVQVKEGLGKVLSLKLHDADAHVLFYEKVEDKGSFFQNFDFNGVEKGKYEFALRTSQGTVRKTLYHELPEPTFPEIELTKKGEDDQYIVAIEESSSLPLYISLYNSFGELIHTQKVEESDDLRKLYNFEKYGQSKATFVFETSEGFRMSKELALK